MKSILVNGLTLGAAMVLSACSSNPGNQDAYQANSSNCSFEFVSDYNSVSRKMDWMMSSRDLIEAESLVNDFSAKYSGVVCNAELYTSGRLDASPTSIDVNSKVASWRASLSSVRATSTTKTSPIVLPTLPALATSPVVPVDPSRFATVKSFSNGITLEVVDATAFNQAANDGNRTLFQNGSSKSKAIVDATSDFCYLEMDSGQTASFIKGEKVKFVTKDYEGNLAAVTVNRSIRLGCGKFQVAPISWTLRDLDKVFGGVVIVSGNP